MLTPDATRTRTGLRLLTIRTAPPGLIPPRPSKGQVSARTSTLPDEPGPLVRPYLLDHEHRQEQQERRVALVLALEGIDVGPWVIHGHHVGAPAVFTTSATGVAA
jgi:hypothetical protein